MTNNEINEYLAEKLFGIRLRCGGEPCGISASRVECGGCEYSVKQTPPDYCLNTMPVLDKLWNDSRILQIEISRCFALTTECQIYFLNEDKETKWVSAIADGMGNAICRAAVKYLKGGACPDCEVVE